MNQREVDLKTMLGNIAKEIEKIRETGPTKDTPLMFIATASDKERDSLISNFFNGDMDFLIALMQSLLVIISKSNSHSAKDIAKAINNMFIDAASDDKIREIVDELFDDGAFLECLKPASPSEVN
jgi:porphobilinogen deaminase